MQAIILAAGMGKRLKELTAHNTKCMIKVGGVTLIERMLRQIEKFGFSRIVIVEGYEGKKLKDFIATLGIKTPIKYINNPIYNKTNNIYSLSLAASELVSDDSVLFESDLIFEDSVIETLLADPEPNLALVDKYENWMDGTCLILGQNDEIKDFVPSSEFCFANKDKYYKTVNIYKFSKEFCQNEYLPFLTAYRKALGDNEYYEQVLKVIIMLDNASIKAKRLDTQSWYEIDDKQDLDIASSIFSKDKKAHLMQIRYGGYWRYPKLLDFSYLVNPYFPPQRLIDEIKANFENLLINYPSGEHINALLASKNFDIKEQNIVVGNGASELIKSVLSYLKDKKLGVIKPSFDEYANRALAILEFHPHTSDFSYSASDIISFFDNKKISALVLINPDNPSGNYLKKQEVLKLVKWSKDKQIRLIYDESFADFSDEVDNSLIKQDLIEQNPHIIIIKSISKSYGIAGARLGIAVSSDDELMRFLKADIAIWNINSFAEFYMQIAEKYKSDYKKALSLFRTERERFFSALNKIKNIKVFSSQANYFMCELFGISSKELTDILIEKHNILIKDLSAKFNGNRHFIRIAIKNTRDNDKVLNALICELEKC